MKKIKILYEGLSANMGGIETYIYNLYKNMDKDKYEIAFMVDKGLKIAFYEEYKRDGIKFFEVENRKNNYFKYLKDMKSIYENNDFDFIHINIMSYSLFERITYACKYSSAKVILHCHNGGYSKNSKYKRTIFLDKLGRLFVKKYSDKLLKVACGEKAGKFGFNNNKFLIFNNGVDIDKFKYSEKSREKFRLDCKIKDNETVFGLVAMFNDPKNHSFLIDIFNEYLKLNNNAKLLLIGEGYLKESIENKVKDLNLSDKVLFLGKQTNVNEWLSAMDIYIMPSLYEGLSISLVEAQVNGLKCFTSNAVDRNSNVTGNVEFLPLEKGAKYWANYMSNYEVSRDYNVKNKIPKEFNANESNKEVYLFYENNLNR